MPAVARTSPADEARHHRASAQSIRLKATKMRRALDNDKLEDAVRVAADVAAELRSPGTTALTPKAYYDVYLSVCAELRVLEMYMLESARRGAPVLHLYERVQETPYVLPRLYLLITAGSVYVQSAQAPAKDVLRDLVEMCAAVQHPQRGLFLRAYLAQMMKDKLPDQSVPANPNDHDDAAWNMPSAAEEEAALAAGGTLLDSVEFVLRNFTEMNRLWVRMKNNVPEQEEEAVRQERLELRLLVGSNLSTLGRLLSTDLNMYSQKVLPAIIEQIVECRDGIAQEYLADCVAQAFPDDFQLATLDLYLRMCANLIRGVNLRTVLISIIDRITKYVQSSAAAKQQVRDVDVFGILHRHFPAVLARQHIIMSLPDRLAVFLALMNLVLTVEQEKTESVDAVLALALESAYLFVGRGDNALVEEVNGTFYTAAPLGSGQNATAQAVNVNPKPTTQPLRSNLTDEEEILVCKIMSMPLEEYQDVAITLRLNNFAELQQMLCFEKQYTLAAKILRTVREYTPCIESVPRLEKLFVLLRPLVVGEKFASIEKSGDDAYLSNTAFNPATLSFHHSYLAAEVSRGTWNPAAAVGGSNLLVPPVLSTEADPSSEPASDNHFRDEKDAFNLTQEAQEFQESQELVSRVVFLCYSDSINGTFSLLEVIRKNIMDADVKRRAVTLPPLIHSALQLAMRANETTGGGLKDDRNEASVNVSPEAILMFAVGCVDALIPEYPMLALRMHLQIATSASTITLGGAGDVVYDSLSRSFLLFENQVNSASDQFVALEHIVCTLSQIRASLGTEAYLALARRGEKHAGNLLKRSDQCLGLLACTGMYGGSSEEEVTRAVACVDKAVEAVKRVSSVAERFFLWVAVANRMIRMVESGEKGAAAGMKKERLRNVLRDMKDMVADRNTKNSPLGRAAIRRRQLIMGHLRSNTNAFSFLNLAEL